MGRFSVDTHLFRELGRLLVGRDSTALVELIKNAYDADATEVTVHGEDLEKGSGGQIVIADNGNGMSPDQFKAGFLTIASRGKEAGSRRSPRFGRRFTGAKGVGRLAAHKLAERLEIFSIPYAQAKGSDRLVGVDALIDWGDIERYQRLEDVPDSAISIRSIRATSADHGTTVKLCRLRKRWTESVRSSFLREVEAFLVPQSIVRDPSAYLVGASLFEKPQIHDVGRNRPKPFNVHFTGDLEIGEDQFEDVVSTADWLIDIDAPKASDTFSVAIIPLVRTKKDIPDARRRVFRLPVPEGAPAFQARIYSRWGKAWEKGGIRVYQEGFRVLPYGEANNDWLELDAVYKQRDRRLRFLDKVGLDAGPEVADEGLTSLGNRGFFGAVLLTADSSTELEMLVNREGFIPNATFDQLRSMVQTAVQLNIRERAKLTAVDRTARREKRSETRAVPTGKALEETIAKASSAVASVDQTKLSANVQASLAAVEASLRDARSAAGTLLTEAATMRILAAIGLQLSTFLHEIRGLLVHVRELERLSEVLRQDLDGSDRKKAVQLHSRVADLRRAIERQTAYLEDVATADARRRRSRQFIDRALSSVVRLYSSEISKKEVRLTNELDEELRTPVPMFGAELVLVLSNLFSNALKAVRHGGRIKVYTRSTKAGLLLCMANTGARVDLAKSERWFLPFESSSTDPEPMLGKGMGLGLTVVKELLEDYNIKIAFVEPPQGFSTALCLTFPAA